MRNLLLIGLLFTAANLVSAEEIIEHNKMMDHGGGHLMDMGGGMVMGQNTDRIPDGCDGIAATKEITVHAGHKYAKKFPGRIYAFDVQEYQFEPCTKLTVHFINEDHVRHQWMMHGLPKYLYPKGMFHLEVTGPGKISGTLILPPGEKTYLVHCDLAQHMEKGMKGQLKTGKGSGDLPSIPGVTEFVVQDDYSRIPPPVVTPPSLAKPADKSATSNVAVQQEGSSISGVMIIGLALGLLLTAFCAKRFKGMGASEIIATLAGWLKQGLTVIGWLFGVAKSGKTKT